MNSEHLLAVATKYPGPGGAVAIVKDGQVLAKRTWGYADLERRIPMDSATMMPICSLTKQFICALLLDVEDAEKRADPSFSFEPYLKDRLPGFTREGLTVQHLCNNQSGIRDYWALTALLGAHPEGRFTKHDSYRVHYSLGVGQHFRPGQQYSYSNSNFHYLARLIGLERPGFDLGEALRERIFKLAGMPHAELVEETNSKLKYLYCVGYEGDSALGFRPAVNNIWWSGDAGIVGSLDDLIAYEQWIDSTRDDPNGLYRRMSATQTFADGKPASYGYGLAHSQINGVPTIGHSGAIRGFRIGRLHAPSERLSVVTMFNHHADFGIAEEVMRSVLGMRDASPPERPEGNSPWYGRYFDLENGLALSVGYSATGGISVTFAGYPEMLAMTGPDTAQSREMSVRRDGNRLHVIRPKDNLTLTCERITGVRGVGYQGTYRCAELDSTLTCMGEDSLIYGSFDGPLGAGPMHLMRHFGGDVWMLECPRGMDAPAPGDWTVAFERAADGQVTGATVGCWLARKLNYVRI